MEDWKIKFAGLLLFVGGAQTFLAVIIAEALYPGYSTSQNFVSDLGVGPSALIFRPSVFLLGMLGFVSIYLIQRVFKSRVFSVCLALTSIGMIGGILFTEDFPMVHTIFSLILIAFGGISAIVSYKFEKSPLSYVSVVLGVVALSALVLLVFGIYLGLGRGGMERMSLYPVLLWLIGFGAYLTK